LQYVEFVVKKAERMNGALVRVAIDQSKRSGMWNGPMDGRTGRFCYVPIPDKEDKLYRPGLCRSYKEVVPVLNEFSVKHKSTILPESLLNRSMHLDPDFEHLTYGDNGRKQGGALKDLVRGDLVVFFSSLRCIENDVLVYALIGFYEILENISASSVEPERYHENAHTRWRSTKETDIIIRANPARGKSGRLEKCIPIGEYRDGAYRLTKQLEKAWGGLEVKDGFLQRRVTPHFTAAKVFRKWFDQQNATLIHSNN
jgi:hypothetical protein